MDSGSSEHGRNVCLDLDQRHDGMWVLMRRMSKLFKSRESLFCRKIKHTRVSLDHLKVEGSNLIEEGGIGSKPRSMIGLVVQDLLDRGGGFGHCSLFLPSLLLRLDVAFCFGGFADEKADRIRFGIQAIFGLKEPNHGPIFFL